MEPQVEKNAHFRHIHLFEYNRGVKASEAARTIRNVYEEESIEERELVLDEDRLNTLLYENAQQTTRELAETMECDQSTIVRHLQSIGKV